jgi:site-specific recombinase XerD
MGINEVAKILGHSSLDVTKIYEHLDPTDLQRRMRELGL